MEFIWLHAHFRAGQKQATKLLVMFLRPMAAYVWRPKRFIDAWIFNFFRALRARSGRGRKNYVGRFPVFFWSPSIGFQNVGSLAKVKKGVDGATNRLLPATAMAQAAIQMQTDKVAAFLGNHQGFGNRSYVVGLHYDATPMRIGFHSSVLRKELQPLARYAVLNKETKKWTVVQYETFKTVCPRHCIRFGVMEVFMQEATIDAVDAAGLVDRAHIVCPPLLLAKGNSSCIHAATERIPGVSVQDLKQLDERSGFVLERRP